MAASKVLIFFFLSTILLCPFSEASSRWFNYVKLTREQETFYYEAIQHDVVYPSHPVITVPATLPISVNPSPYSTPLTAPTTIPPPTPVTKPPPTSTTTYPTPPNGGKGWCVAKSGVQLQQSALQGALDYACGSGKADCSAIQPGATCFNPNTLQNHASYAFNSYYQKNPVPTSCDFGGAAILTNVNPSVGSCIYPTSSSPPTTTTPVSAVPPPTTSTPVSAMPPPTTTTPVSAMPPPTTTTPVSAIPPPARSTPISATPPPTMPSPFSGTPTSPSGTTPSTSTPPTVLNSSNPTLGGFPTGFTDSPPPLFSTTPSTSSSLQPCIGGITAVAFLITVKLVLDYQDRY